PETAWQRIPAQYRKFVRDNNIRVFILPGFDIARKATDRGELQLRMQGNSFLGAFFRVSPFLQHNGISETDFLATVTHQYETKFDSEFRSGRGYHQPASALASVGVMGAGTGATQSKYVARRETPVYIAENCTQCMECITACPDTALPNTSQDVNTVLKTAAHY